jgi:isoquinoline 1-oxidoreductase beta subunit
VGAPYQADMTVEISRRQLLIGGGAGVGLIVAWAAWPRRYGAHPAAAPGETVMGPFLKIGTDGHVTVIVPQAETGQGAWTALPQLLADELGCDWRTVAVEPAPIGPLYANRLAVEGLAADVLPAPLRAVAGALADRWAAEQDAMLTGFSTSVRAFEQPMREAGATARALLCMAAAKRWDADWRACDAQGGFVIRGNDKLRFAELAAEAATLSPPKTPPLRAPGEGRLAGQPLPRIDVPAKIDGSMRFAADVRLPGMVFAAIRQAPAGHSRLVHLDRQAARALPDLIAILENPGWVAAVADNWWAANRALDTLAPRFETQGGLPDAASIDAALANALAVDGHSVLSHGKPDGLIGATAIHADYGAGLAAHAALETPAATARITNGRLELWVGTQAPAAARAAAARAIGFAQSDVILYPMPLGGGFGMGFDTRPAEQAAILAQKLGRPVQLMWSRVEEMLHDRFRPPARARMSASLGPGGTIAAWHARVATPSAVRDTVAGLWPSLPVGQGGDASAVDGMLPGYAIPAVAIDHHPAQIGLPTGILRGEAAGVTTFFAESFIDELAAKAGADPLSFRITLLGANPRLAHCLSTAATLGGWEGGGKGTGQGLACFMGYGSFIAMMAEAHVGADGRIAVSRLTASVDCGRIVNPDLVRQQIEGGLLFALPAAIGDPITVTRGLVDQRRLAALGLPKLAQLPELHVDLVASTAASGGVSGLAVPPVAPAIANALAAATGRRSRHLPLSAAA